VKKKDFTPIFSPRIVVARIK